jgi:hypothetical protein
MQQHSDRSQKSLNPDDWLSFSKMEKKKNRNSFVPSNVENLLALQQSLEFYTIVPKLKKLAFS